MNTPRWFSKSNWIKYSWLHWKITGALPVIEFKSIWNYTDWLYFRECGKDSFLWRLL